MTLRLDQHLERFLGELDTKVGAGRWSMIVTSDHGASPMPERTHGGRISYAQIKDAANHAAIAELGPGEWIASAKYPAVYLSKALLAQKDADKKAAIKKIVLALRSFPGLERVERTADVMGHCETRSGDALAICMALDPERSGEVLYLPAPGWVMEDESEHIATGHGSIHAYDREVPLLILEPGRTPHAALDAPDPARVSMVRISTILARWLGVTPPLSLPR
jgi:hypothetical protein